MLLDKALEYVDKVIEGEIKAPKEVKQQCEMFLDDYNRCINGLDDEYFFDTVDIEVAEDILSLVRFPKGVFV